MEEVDGEHSIAVLLYIIYESHSPFSLIYVEGFVDTGRVCPCDPAMHVSFTVLVVFGRRRATKRKGDDFRDFPRVGL